MYDFNYNYEFDNPYSSNKRVYTLKDIKCKCGHFIEQHNNNKNCKKCNCSCYIPRNYWLLDNTGGLIETFNSLLDIAIFIVYKSFDEECFYISYSYGYFIYDLYNDKYEHVSNIFLEDEYGNKLSIDFIFSLYRYIESKLETLNIN